FFVTRPAIPEPLSALISIPCSAAIRRTSGEDLVRRRSSSELPFPCAAAGAAGGCVGAEGGGAAAAGADGVGAAAAAAGAGAAGAATAALPSVSSRATTVCTATV